MLLRCPAERASGSCDVFFFQAEDGIRDVAVTGVQTCALPISTMREKKSQCAAPSEFLRKPRHRQAAQNRRKRNEHRGARSELRRMGPRSASRDRKSVV